MPDEPTPGVAVIILSYNEERNMPQVLGSVVGWADEVFVVDSFSSDGTVSVAEGYDCHVVQHRFEDYAKQRNFALDQLPIASEWILFLDADEWATDELKREISELVLEGAPALGEAGGEAPSHEPARATVWWNGVKVHDNVQIKKANVEISIDGGAWHPVSGTAVWSYAWHVPAAWGPHTLRARAYDAVGKNGLHFYAFDLF